MKALPSPKVVLMLVGCGVFVAAAAWIVRWATQSCTKGFGRIR